METTLEETVMTDEDYERGHQNLMAYLKADGGRSVKNHILRKLESGDALNPIEEAMAETVFLSLQDPKERLRMGLMMPFVIVRCPNCHYHSNM